MGDARTLKLNRIFYLLQNFFSVPRPEIERKMTVGLAERLISRSPVLLTTVARKSHAQRICKRLLDQPPGDQQNGVTGDFAARMVRTGEDWRRPCFPRTTGTKGSAALRPRSPALSFHSRGVAPDDSPATSRCRQQTVRTSRTGETKHTEQCTRHKVCKCNFSGRSLGFPHEH